MLVTYVKTIYVKVVSFIDAGSEARVGASDMET